MTSSAQSNPQDLRHVFSQLKSPRAFLALLGVKYSSLIYYFRKMPKSDRYKSFSIPKRSSGQRQILAPIKPIKAIQRRLNKLLQGVYEPTRTAHGFIAHRGIVTNAGKHSSKRWVLNIDLKDFFPSIHFGRVRGMFMNPPYGLPEAVATLIAQICCHDILPQGAPTSPIVSNMICVRLDKQLSRFSRMNRCSYSRYADDITFSTNLKHFPDSLCTITSTALRTEVSLANELTNIIKSNGFELNQSKIRAQPFFQRQEVTGLTTNRKVNTPRKFIRQIRAMLHAREVHGLALSEKEFFARYDYKKRAAPQTAGLFDKILRGKIEFLGSVRGFGDPLYCRYMRMFCEITGKPFFLKDPQSVAELLSLEPSIWIVDSQDQNETKWKQGTAFMLKGFGLITCDHVLWDRHFVYRGSDPDKRYEARIKKRDAVIDLALLDIGQYDFPELSWGYSGDLTPLTPINVLGYPRYSKGDTLRISPGAISGYKVLLGNRRMHTSAHIIEGTSGGPAIDDAHRVIGIAVTGTDSDDNAHKTDMHGLIPIGTLKVLFSDCQRP